MAYINVNQGLSGFTGFGASEPEQWFLIPKSDVVKKALVTTVFQATAYASKGASAASRVCPATSAKYKALQKKLEAGTFGVCKPNVTMSAANRAAWLKEVDSVDNSCTAEKRAIAQKKNPTAPPPSVPEVPPAEMRDEEMGPPAPMPEPSTGLPMWVWIAAGAAGVGLIILLSKKPAKKGKGRK